MQLGISTACFYPLPVEQALDEIGRLGLRAVEIFFNTESEYFEPLISEIERHVHENGLEVRSIHPFTSANEGILLFSEYTRRTEDAFAQYRHYLQLDTSPDQEGCDRALRASSNLTRSGLRQRSLWVGQSRSDPVSFDVLSCLFCEFTAGKAWLCVKLN